MYDMKKTLPPRIGSELWLKLDYGIFRAMETGKFYKSKQNGGFITIKPIKEKGIPEQFQFHVRFQDQYGNTQDLDAYVDLSIANQLQAQIETWRAEGVKCDVDIENYAVIRYHSQGELVRTTHLSSIIARESWLK